MSITSETYNKTYNKPANQPHSFVSLGGNIFVPFLLRIITLRFTCGILVIIKECQNILPQWQVQK